MFIYIDKSSPVRDEKNSHKKSRNQSNFYNYCKISLKVTQSILASDRLTYEGRQRRGEARQAKQMVPRRAPHSRLGRRN